MPLSPNEIKSRALAFSKEWENETIERGEAQTFWNEFFNVFGIIRRKVATFEKLVTKSDGSNGYIDLLWKGMLLVEHKSRGKDLERAKRQAFDYFSGIKDRDYPRYVIVSDFARFRLYDLDEDKPPYEFPLTEFYNNVERLYFIAGYQTRSFGQEDPVNIKAAESLGRLHDQLRDSGYIGHKLEVLLVRLLFCLFAEDTTIFDRSQFQDYIEQRTLEDGSDLGMRLGKLFEVLKEPFENRQTKLDEQLLAFQYINGKLFDELLPTADFDPKMRETLLDCCALDWSRISPAIFGSLFQSIMDDKARRNIGAHYTTETNIMKALRPLFLDGLRLEFERIKKNRASLLAFQIKLSQIRIMDPACGCGNFLVIAYRELRILELDILMALHEEDLKMSFVDVDKFYGIELEEFPAQIAQVAMWLMDHQMNMRASKKFGERLVRLPLRKAANIVHGNALRLDWREIVRPEELSYIVGNPPFVGKKEQSETQKSEVLSIFSNIKGAGVIDYVSCWYMKAANYMRENPAIRAAFVSTNSITQGEQVGVLWPSLFASGVRINFAHRTFQWSSEARGKAAVHCVIIGFALEDEPGKWLFDYETPQSEPHSIKASIINPYLVDGPNISLENRSLPICKVQEISYGSFALDDGNFTLSEDERQQIIVECPKASSFIRPFIGGQELIHGEKRYCLWLKDAEPQEIVSMPPVLKRVEAVSIWRKHSGRKTTRELATIPNIFAEIRQPNSRYLAFPTVSSEKRHYIPIAFLNAEVIASNQIYVLPSATLYHFGVLSSTMHMAWVRAVCGRLKSDYRYSASIVYNNFPWPEPTEAQRTAIETGAQGVLSARLKFPSATLADLYNPLTMPPELSKAHSVLDRAVDRAYGKQTFNTEAERVALLFSLYQQLTSILPEEKPKKRKAIRKPA